MIKRKRESWIENRLNYTSYNGTILTPSSLTLSINRRTTVEGCSGQGIRRIPHGPLQAYEHIKRNWILAHKEIADCVGQGQNQVRRLQKTPVEIRLQNQDL